MRVAETIEWDAQAGRELRVLFQSKRIEVRLKQRERIVVLAAKGLQNKQIALEAGLDRRQVALWRTRLPEEAEASIFRLSLRRGSLRHCPPVTSQFPNL